MNQRIQELYTQALENKFDYGGGEGVKPGEYYSNYKTVLNAEKFAELIVRECISELEKIKRSGVPTPIQSGLNLGVVSLKEHFGVK